METYEFLEKISSKVKNKYCTESTDTIDNIKKDSLEIMLEKSKWYKYIKLSLVDEAYQIEVVPFIRTGMRQYVRTFSDKEVAFDYIIEILNEEE